MGVETPKVIGVRRGSSKITFLKEKEVGLPPEEENVEISSMEMKEQVKF